MLAIYNLATVFSVFCIYTTYAQTDTCKLAFNNASGTFATPNFPERVLKNVVCEWTISVKLLNSIILNVTSQLPAITEPCQSTLKIYEGLGESKTLQNTFCNGRMDYPFVLMKVDMTVIYETASTDGPSIRMSYATGPQCGDDIENSDHVQKIELPAHPAYFGKPTSCFWSITSPEGFAVQLTVTDYIIEQSKNCLNGVITIVDKTANNIQRPIWNTCEPGKSPTNVFNTSKVEILLALITTKPTGIIIEHKVGPTIITGKNSTTTSLIHTVSTPTTHLTSQDEQQKSTSTRTTEKISTTTNYAGRLIQTLSWLTLVITAWMETLMFSTHN